MVEAHKKDMPYDMSTCGSIYLPVIVVEGEEVFDGCYMDNYHHDTPHPIHPHSRFPHRECNH